MELLQTIWLFIQDQILGMKWLNVLVGNLISAIGLDPASRWGGSIQFFIYDVIKITILLCTLIFMISYIQSYFPPERSKRILGRFHGIGANIIAALLGTVTPFCSCSSIPLFIGFTSAGLPLGVTFSFLISSPMVDIGNDGVYFIQLKGNRRPCFYRPPRRDDRRTNAADTHRNGGGIMIDSWLNALSSLISESMWLAPVLALLAGVLTSFTPCSLSSIPLVIGYVGGTGTEPKKAFRLSLVFAAGSAVTFTILGTLASLAGRLVGTSASWWYLALGVLMVLMALQTWEIFNFIPSTYLLSKSTRRGYAGALIAGILGGVFSSPCATPVLIALLAIVAGKGSVAWGMLELSGNIIKNVKSVIVPNTDGAKGIEAAAAIGIIAGNADLALEVISAVTDEQKQKFREYLRTVNIHVRQAPGDLLCSMSSRLKWYSS